MSPMRTPGRPASPTLHSRTKAEGAEYATRNRATSDWFRHDGKNVEEMPPPAARLHGAVAPEVAEKNKGAPAEWYEHSPDNPTDPAPKSRTHTKEAEEVHDKIAGKEEAWYKHEDNRDYHTPRPKSRLVSQEGEDVMNKLGRADTMDWYRHEHGPGDDFSSPPPKARTGAVPYGEDNKEKLHPTATPEWYAHKPGTGDESQEEFHGTPLTRLKTAEANDYKQRSQQGSASSWYGHDASVSTAPGAAPRGSARSVEIQDKMKSESGNWFSHDGSQQDHTDARAQGRGGSAVAQDLANRARGNEMNAIMHSTKENQPEAPKGLKPGESNAQKNKDGMMSKYMDYEANKGYNTDRAGGRAIKGEGIQNQQKNQGCMSDIMGGYPAGGPASHDGPRVRPEAKSNADKNKGSMGGIISHDGKPDAPHMNRMTSEAANNKARNQGTMNDIMGGTSQMGINDGPKHRGMTDQTRAAVDRNRGTMSHIMGGGN